MGNKAHKKMWEEEMVDLFNEYKPIPGCPEPPEGHSVPEVLKVPWLFQFWDISHKFLSVMNNTLIATPQNSNSPGSSFAVFPNTCLDPKKNPIFMGVGNCAVSCRKSGDGQPQLQVMEKDIEMLYKAPEEFKNFTFYSMSGGRPETCSFESAEFPGWFISTSSEPNKPIGLSQRGGPENILFYFEKKK
ncbi:interleukin-36 alpha-like [Python bivittatus]|uniref:Interleukin-1 receptor antagonist protein n=1 Tax=Python bivittatus TaxID=176946 RepID=A0A9F5IR53_PYTBI|nr:interleukin-36 alpha-like [Python bivittatus]